MGSSVDRRGRRCGGACKAGSADADQLLHESLNREMAKLSRGAKRPADVAGKVRAAPPTPPRRFRSRQAAAPIQWSPFKGSASAPPLVRLLAMACLLLPLVAAVPYGVNVLARVSILRDLVFRPLLPLIRVYHSSQYGGLFAIVGLYGLVAKNKSMHPYLRSVGMQASLLLMMRFPFSFLLNFAGSMSAAIGNLVSSLIFVYYLYCVAVAGLGCLTSQVADLPGIGDGRSLPTRPSFGRRPFRGSS